MKAIEFVGQNIMLMPPSTMARGTCGQLPAFQSPDGRYVSVWAPTAEEIEQLKIGAYVLLHIYGANHPPVAVEVGAVEPLP